MLHISQISVLHGCLGFEIKGGMDVKGYYRLPYMSVIDQMMQIKKRLVDLENLKFLQLLNNSLYEQMHNEFPVEAFHSLITIYGHHFDADRLTSEFYSEREMHGESGKLCGLLREFKLNDLDKVMPELFKLSCLHWSYICRGGKELFMPKTDQELTAKCNGTRTSKLNWLCYP